MHRLMMALLLPAVLCAGWTAAGLPDKGLDAYWITEADLAPGLTDEDRVPYSFPIENADGWTVADGTARVESGGRFYGNTCLRLAGRGKTFVWRECRFTVNRRTFVTCAFLRQAGATATFMLRDEGGQWHEARANSGLYWTHGYQHVTGRFTSFFFKPQLKVGDEITAVGLNY